MKTLLENWDLFCSKLEKVEQNNKGIKALCPSHDDKNPSLTAYYTDEKIFVYCHARCSFKSIVNSLGMNESQFFAKEKTKSSKSREVARYRYEDKEGEHAFDVIRYERKGFRQQRPNGIWSLEGVERVPYRLSLMLTAIKEGKEILILEGEKDCDNAENIGLTATTFAGGAGKWREEYSKWFQDAKVICLPDNDDAGRKGMRLIASEIVKVAEFVSWLELPDIPAKGDLSDWLKINGNNIEKFSSLVRQSSSIWKSELVKDDDDGQLLEELNQKFAIVPTGNKFTIVNETENETMFLAPSDFRLALQNRFATDSSGKFPKQIQASSWWLTHPERREYKSVDFLPIAETPYGVFNMWKGFAVKPIGGLEDIPLFHELIDEVICSGNEQ